jgi:hypothetical protein
VAYAHAPEAIAVRAEISRTLLDLLSEPPSRRLASTSDLLAAGVRTLAALAGADGGAGASSGAAVSAAADPVEAGEAEESLPGPARRIPAADRRRAFAWLMEVWIALARDLLSATLGDPRRVHDPSLLDELGPLAGRLPREAIPRFLDRIAEAARRVTANVSPELALDVLVLDWPRIGSDG